MIGVTIAIIVATLILLWLLTPTFLHVLGRFTRKRRLANRERLPFQEIYSGLNNYEIEYNKIILYPLGSRSQRFFMYTQELFV